MKRRGGKNRVAAATRTGRSATVPPAVCAFLRQYLVHTREIPNGRDFLFAGPAERIHEALQGVVEAEHRSGGRLHVDYAQIDEYFLLRVVGAEADQEAIKRYLG